MPKLVTGTQDKSETKERVPNTPTDVCCQCEKSFVWIRSPQAKKQHLCYWCFNAPPKRVIYSEDQLTYHGKSVAEIKREQALRESTKKKQVVQNKIDKSKTDRDMKARNKRKFNPWRPIQNKSTQDVED